MGMINYATYSGSLWSIIAIGLMAYTALTVEYSVLRHANLASKILLQTVAAQILLVALDHSTGYNGWSVNYGIPSTILFADLSIVFFDSGESDELAELFYVSDCCYSVQLYSFDFMATGLLTRPFLALFTVTVTVIILAVTIVLGDRSVKTELKRRFHV